MRAESKLKTIFEFKNEAKNQKINMSVGVNKDNPRHTP